MLCPDCPDKGDYPDLSAYLEHRLSQHAQPWLSMTPPLSPGVAEALLDEEDRDENT